MQFKTLASLLAEGPVHFLVTEVADGRIRVYVEPKPTKEQQGQKAASSPFSVCDTAENLDAGFDAALTEWIDSRGATLQDLAAGLAASKAQLASAAAEGKTGAPKAKPAKPAASAPAFAAKGAGQGSNEVPPPEIMVAATNIGPTGEGADPYPMAVGQGIVPAQSAAGTDNEE